MMDILPCTLLDNFEFTIIRSDWVEIMTQQHNNFRWEMECGPKSPLSPAYNWKNQIDEYSNAWSDLGLVWTDEKESSGQRRQLRIRPKAVRAFP
jgi:hypothetical protein